MQASRLCFPRDCVVPYETVFYQNNSEDSARNKEKQTKNLLLLAICSIFAE
jgi:hypothetical protein